ncbi:MAG: response regulator [Erythrobacter sp.]
MTATARTILIVENEYMIAWELAEHLEENGYRVMGPCASLAQAEAAIKVRRPDAAILDIGLNDGRTGLVLALKLRKRGVPFVFVTGFDAAILEPADLKGVALLRKPVEPRAVIAHARRMCAVKEPCLHM